MIKNNNREKLKKKKKKGELLISGNHIRLSFCEENLMYLVEIISRYDLKN